NIWQISETGAVYPVTYFDDQGVAGGTTWAIQMYIDRCLTTMNVPNIYVFDQLEGSWYSYVDGKWVKIDRPPTPTGKWTGIGSRDLTALGKKAIKEVFDVRV